MKHKAFVRFTMSDTNASEIYRMRFSKVVSEKMLGGIEFVHLHKTDNYIIVTPITEAWKADGDNSAIPLVRKSDGSVLITLNRLVKREAFLHKGLFGHRYKVKRDRYGRIYVCLNEVVDDDRKG